MAKEAWPPFGYQPDISVGVVDGVRELRGRFDGPFRLHGGRSVTGPFAVAATEKGIRFSGSGGTVFEGHSLTFGPERDGTFLLSDVAIGVRFHWERRQQQIFQGELVLTIADGMLTAVNRLPLENYLTSVVASEMSDAAPLEMLKAHAIASRSWLAAMLQRRAERKDNRIRPGPLPSEAGESPAPVFPADAVACGQGEAPALPVEGGMVRLPAAPGDALGGTGEIVRWYDREDHARFDVCADDHCQRYRGITADLSGRAAEAVRATRGIFIVHDGKICDARYSKACGGRTDHYENTWEEIRVPYLTSVADADAPQDPVNTEAAARRWVDTRPEVFCNCTDQVLLRHVLPDFDRETADFFRWRVVYGREALQMILSEKSGIDFGTLHALVPLQRGPSGRIIRLRIEGSRRTVTVGKELEIRRWLSRSHLYSSAFCVSVERDASGLPERFILDGAGWGHGVGLCQIGAAVMAEKGRSAEEILKHYFRGAGLTKLY